MRAMHETGRAAPQRARRALRALWTAGRVARSMFGGPRAPVTVTYHLTYRCNLDCSYCGQPPTGPELSVAGALGIVDELAAAGTLRLGFSGGEPLIRDDLGGLVAAAQRHGLFATVTTNGTLLADRVALVRDVDRLFVSLDGGEEAHDRHRGAGAFARTCRGLERARSAGIRVDLVAVVTRRSMGDAATLATLARDLGARVYFQPVMPRWGGAPVDGALHADEARTFFRGLQELKRRRLPIGNSDAHLAGAARDPRMPIRGPCPAGWLSAAVLPDGAVVACCEAHFSAPPSAGETAGATVRVQLQRVARPDCETCVTVGNVELRRIARLSPFALVAACGALAERRAGSAGA